MKFPKTTPPFLLLNGFFFVFFSGMISFFGPIFKETWVRQHNVLLGVITWVHFWEWCFWPKNSLKIYFVLRFQRGKLYFQGTSYKKLIWKHFFINVFSTENRSQKDFQNRNAGCSLLKKKAAPGRKIGQMRNHIFSNNFCY